MRQAGNARDPMWRAHHAKIHADAASKGPAGGVDLWGRGDPLLTLTELTPEQYALAARSLRRIALTHECTAGAWCRNTVAHLAEDAVLEHFADDPADAADDGVLFVLELRSPPAGEPPPRPPPEITTELREAAEVYLQEHANGGAYGLYERLAKRLVPDGCDDPVRYLRNLLSSCRRHGWLATNKKAHASLPGPLLDQARREGQWDEC